MSGPTINPFGDSELRKQIEKLPDQGKGGDISIAANTDGAEAEVSVALTNNWTVAGWARTNWNGMMDWAGVTRFKW